MLVQDLVLQIINHRRSILILILLTLLLFSLISLSLKLGISELFVPLPRLRCLLRRRERLLLLFILALFGFRPFVLGLLAFGLVLFDHFSKI